MDLIKLEPEVIIEETESIQISNNILLLKKAVVQKEKKENTNKSVSRLKNRVKAKHCFQCNVCPYNTFRKPFLDKHVLQKHGFLKINDEKKSEKVSSNSNEKMDFNIIKNDVNMEAHQTQWESHKEHESVEVGCKRCDFKTTHLNLLSLHEEIHQGEDVYQCIQCKFTTEEVNALREHEKVHKKLMLFHCMNCDYATRQKCNLRQHVRMHQDPGKVERYNCSTCLFVSFHYSALMRHIRRKHNKDGVIFKCESCPFTSKMQRRLTAHQKIHDTHDDMPMFKCEECDFVTYNEVTMQKHVNRHKERQKDGQELIVKEQRNEKELVWFCCNMCSFRSKEQRYVMLHKKVHARVDEINKAGENIVLIKKADGAEDSEESS